MRNFPFKKRHPSSTSSSTINFANTPTTCNINGFYQNCRGLRTKLVNFNCNTSCFNYFFIVLTETWLSNSFYSSELGLDNYNIYRCDRSPQTSSFNRGGGVLVAVRKDIDSSPLIIPYNNVEQLFVRFSLNSLNIIISSVYIPPSSPIDLYTTHLNTIDFIVHNYPNHSFILTGDYNLPFISWSNDAHGLCFLSHTISEYTAIPERLAIHGFFQHNYILNSHHSLLDLIFSNLNSITVKLALDPAVPADTYHPPLSLSINLPIHAPQSASLKSFYNFNKADYTQITNFFNYFNWKSTFLSYSPDDSMSVFLDALHYSILTFVPKISFRPSTFPSWYTKELKELVFAKSRAHAKFKSSQLLTDYKHFSLLRAKFKFISKQCYRNFVSRTESSLLHNPKYFWSFIRKNRSSQSIPSCVSLHGKQSTSLPDTANLFAAYFSSVFTQPSPTPSQTLHPICLFPLPSNSYFSISDVYKCLCSLRNVKSVGPDGIQGDFLYKLRSVLAEPLWLLFGRSIDSGIFPSALKLGSIRPILKSGDSIDVSNYRPITILPHLSKIFESLVLNSIRSPLNHILIDEQHGFRPGRSTLTCNLSLHSYIYDSFRNNCQVDVIYTDFSKAFDRVDHNHLMSTLDSLGIGEPLLSWFRSYITNRIQWVTVDSTSSDHFTPSSGVPQGAVLSPLLFALFVNSAVSVLHHAKLLIFADDMKIFFRIKSISDCHLLQNDLQRLVAWGESLGLALNIAKCSVMTFSRINAAIEHTYTVNNTALTTCNNYVKDLGFTLTRNLCPNMHIQIICCKALKLLGFINRVSSDFHLLSPLKTLFCSLVRPILEYGSVLWDPSTASARSMIERVQRKFLRQAAYKLKIVCPPHDYAPIHRLFSLESLADRRHSANVTFLSNLLSSKIDSPELLSQVSFNVPSRCTRSSVPFHIPFSSSNYYLNSPIIRLMRIANTDPSFSL